MTWPALSYDFANLNGGTNDNGLDTHKPIDYHSTTPVRRYTMAVEEIGERYVCKVCGNEVSVTKVGGGTLVCCGEDMEKQEVILL